ncbi:MAG: hypothetical protein K8R77_00540 [Anaerolineaceae bacterium]|nr:hypothetical protein [Anaerolineaceae bacterium]
MFDIYTLPLHRSAGQESVRIPGLLVKDAPKRAHRNRSEDILFLFLTLEEDAWLPFSQMDELLNRLATTYFNSRGSATTGLRTVAEDLNSFLLKKNQSGHGNRQKIGIFNLAVLRRNQIFVVHAGDTKSFFLGKTGVQTFYEPFTAGRGLGVGRSIQLSYFQTEAAPGDLLIFCPEPPESWTAGTLEDISRLPLGQIRRRILEPSLNELRAVLLQFRRGQGRIYQPRAQGIQSEAPVEPAAPPAAAEPPGSPPPMAEAPPAEPAIEKIPLTTLPPVPDRQTAEPDTSGVVPSASPTGQVSMPQTKQPGPRRQMRRSQPEVKEKLADLWVSGKATQGKIKNRLSKLLGRFLPGDDPLNLSLSPKTMLAIAIVVPVLIAVIASAVYFTTGRNEQRQEYLSRAMATATEADITSDPTLRATSWMQVLTWLDQADNFGQSEESRMLRAKAEETLDTINDITRLNYYPILGTDTNRGWHITQMVANESDIYLLDSNSGTVQRLIQTGQDYEYSLDPNFKCGPGAVDGITIQPLVDMVVLNKKMFDKPIPKGAPILALDKAGNYLFCVPDLEPVSGTLATPAEGWGEIKSIEISEIGMFVLSPDNNAMWFFKHDNSEDAEILDYEGSKDRFFFDATIPNLKDVVDVVYFENQIYLLHESGTMTICDPRIVNEKNEIQQPTVCTDMPIDLVKYAISDAATANTGSFQNQFSQMMSNPAPFSYVTILDSKQAVIYQFTTSLKTLNEKFYPKFDADYRIPEGEPTAFTIVSPGNRVILLAYGNQLFKAVP